MKRYKINEVFWSPQGEGVRAGEMSVFVRFTGCNMKCAIEPGARSPGGFDCDTEFESGRWLSKEELVAYAIAACVDGGMERDHLDAEDANVWVVFTGGEPAIQLDSDLVKAFRDAGFLLAIETNGSMDVSDLDLDWVTVSPKVAEHAIRQMNADEVKYVRGHGQALPKTVVQATHYLISPAFNGLVPDRKAIDWCLSLIKADPRWRLSIQMHKAWGVR